MASTFSLEKERVELRKFVIENFKSPQKDEFTLTLKDSSLKRTHVLLRKLKLLATEDSAGIQHEIKHVNLSMHISELCESVLSNSPKNSVEYLMLTKAIVCIMAEEPDFRLAFARELWKHIEEAASNLQTQDKASYSRFRALFRVSCELHVVGAFNALPKSASLFKKLLGQEDSKAAELVAFVTYTTKMFKESIFDSQNAKDGLCRFDDLSDCILTYFKAMRRYLLRLFNLFKGLEEKSKKHFEQKGDLPLDLSTSLSSSYSAFETFRVSLAGLAEVLGAELPELKSSEPQFQEQEGKIIFVRDLDALNAKKIEIFEDEAERSFYECLPQFSNASDLGSEEFTISNIEELDVNPDKPSSSSLDEKDLPRDVLLFFKAFENVNNIEGVDALSEKFIASGSFKLENYLEIFFDLSRKRNEIIPLLARFLATNRTQVSALIKTMNQSICGQFNFLVKRKEPILGTRRRICRFVAELTKFGLLSTSDSFYCLKKCVRDFSGPNIDMCCLLLESCGRYLYFQADCHARISHLVKLIQNKRKSSLDISPERQIFITNALTCLTFDQFQPSKVNVDLREMFCSFALGSINSDCDAFEFLKSIDWQDEVFLSFLQDFLVNPKQFKSANIRSLCSGLQRLRNFCPIFVINVLDQILAASLDDSKSTGSFDRQNALSRCAMITELFGVGLLLFENLLLYAYKVISLNHDGNLPACDGPENHFRIRMICTVLEKLRPYLLDSHLCYIYELLALFRCYICSKSEISDELDEEASNIFAVYGCRYHPLHVKLAISSFSRFSVAEMMLERLDFLKAAEFSESFGSEEVSDMAESLLGQISTDFDKEMTKLVGQSMEAKKLEKRPQSFEFSVPIYGAAKDSNSNSNLCILLKKKKKAILKPISDQKE